MPKGRRQFRVQLVVMIVTAVIVPLGFALSLPSKPDGARIGARLAAPAASVAALTTVTAAGAMLVADEDEPSGTLLQDVPDAAKLFFVGSMLVGLAVAARKAA
jgi:hypothetical protein